MKPKRWALCMWEQYYPNGSTENIHSCYETQQEAITALKEYSPDRWDIVDLFEYIFPDGVPPEYDA